MLGFGIGSTEPSDFAATLWTYNKMEFAKFIVL
jgi:hypothetical protein